MAAATNGKPGSSQDRSGRAKILQELDSFIQTSETHLQDLLTQIGWTRDSLQEETLVACSHDPHHRMPDSSLSKHLSLCQWLKEGYTREDYNETNSSAFFYHNTNSVFSITMDQETQNNILTQVNGCPTVKPIPRTAERACTGFSQKEKLAIYDYIVAQGQRSRASSSSSKLINEVGEDPDSSGGTYTGKETSETKTMSRLEMLKQMRDYKRRRQSYRAKNVHITKRSQTDIMREIIKNQMDELESERQSSGVMNEASSIRTLDRDLKRVNERSGRDSEEKSKRLVGRYQGESERKQLKNANEDQGDSKSPAFFEPSDGRTESWENAEIDRWDQMGRGETCKIRDYEEDIRRRLGAYREDFFVDAEKYDEMTQSDDWQRTRITSPAERSQGLCDASSKYKKHKHHKRHKTRD